MFHLFRPYLSPEFMMEVYSLFHVWYEKELHIYKEYSRNEKVIDSACFQIGNLNPYALLTPEGMERIDYHFGRKSPSQKTTTRLYDFYAELVLQYGHSIVEELRRRCIQCIIDAYNLDKKQILELDKKYNTFWFYIFFKRELSQFVEK